MIAGIGLGTGFTGMNGLASIFNMAEPNFINGFCSDLTLNLIRVFVPRLATLYFRYTLIVIRTATGLTLLRPWLVICPRCTGGNGTSSESTVKLVRLNDVMLKENGLTNGYNLSVKFHSSLYQTVF